MKKLIDNIVFKKDVNIDKMYVPRSKKDVFCKNVKCLIQGISNAVLYNKNGGIINDDMVIKWVCNNDVILLFVQGTELMVTYNKSIDVRDIALDFYNEIYKSTLSNAV